MQENREPSVGEILDSLVDETTINNLEFKFFLESLSSEITRRQAIILRLMLMGITHQIEIAKMLGYSFVTISVDVRKLRKIIRKILEKEGIKVPYPLQKSLKIKVDNESES